MWKYNQTPNADELFHARAHKYVAKVGEGKDAIYFYSMADYQSYLSSKKNRGPLVKNHIRENGLGYGSVTGKDPNGKVRYTYSYQLSDEKTKAMRKEARDNMKKSFKGQSDYYKSGAKAGMNKTNANILKSAARKNLKSAKKSFKRGKVLSGSQYVLDALSFYKSYI